MIGFLLGVFVILQALDGLSTYKALASSAGKEGNPAVVWLYAKLGLKRGVLTAMETGRRSIGIEVEERYCEIAARRLGGIASEAGGQGVMAF